MEEQLNPTGNNSANNKKVAIIVIIVAVLAIALAIGWSYSGRSGGAPTGGGSGNEEVIGDGVVLRTATEGTVTKEFPKELIAEEGVTIDSSYVIAYENESLNQPVVHYVSALNVAQNVESYKALLVDQGWDIYHEPEAGDSAPYFYAYRDRGGNVEEVNITFSESEGKVEVNIAYLGQAG